MFVDIIIGERLGEGSWVGLLLGGIEVDTLVVIGTSSDGKSVGDFVNTLVGEIVATVVGEIVGVMVGTVVGKSVGGDVKTLLVGAIWSSWDISANGFNERMQYQQFRHVPWDAHGQPRGFKGNTKGSSRGTKSDTNWTPMKSHNTLKEPRRPLGPLQKQKTNKLSVYHV